MEFDRLAELLREEQRVVPFSVVVQTLKTHYGCVDFKAITSREPFFEETLKVSLNGRLVFPFLSIINQGGVTRSLQDFSLEDQRLILEGLEATSSIKRTAHVGVYCAATDSVAAGRICEMLESYFYSNILPNSTRAAARKMIRKYTNSGEREMGIERLAEINKSEFKLSTYIFIPQKDRAAPTGSLLGGDVALGIEDIAPLASSTLIRKRPLSETIMKSGKRLCGFSYLLTGDSSRDRIGVIAVVGDEDGLSQLAAVTIEMAIHRINNQRMTTVRARSRERLQAMIIDTAKSEGEGYKSKFTAFCCSIVEHLILTTSAHSATIRKYDSFSNTLKLVAHRELPAAGEPLDSSKTEIVEDIPLDPSRSATAYCFIKTRDDGCLELPDVDVIPSEYRLEGLMEVRKCRIETVSEYCIPIVARGLRYGVLNLEAPFTAAFSVDQESVRYAVFLISQYLETANSAEDRWWLSQLSFTHLAAHGLVEFRRSLDSSQQRKLDGIIRTLTPPALHDPAGSKTWNDIIRVANDHHVTHTLSRNFEDIWKLRGIDLNLKVSARFLKSVEVIFASIFSNLKHTRYEENEISIERVSNHGPRTEYLITYSANISFVNPDILNELFVIPRIQPDGWHFGLYLIGVHARLLGGDVAIDPNCAPKSGYAPFRFRIRLPEESQ